MKKLVIACNLLIASWSALAYEPFVVTDIRVDGLQRISTGTVFNYLPIEVGYLLDSEAVGNGMRALFKTGFFDDVQFDHEGSILVVTVSERPAVSAIDITGNKDIETEDLLNALSQIGVAEGEIFDKQDITHVEQELIHQYFSHGKYNVDIDFQINDLPRNRVDINLTITEGKAAKIKHINIIGNTVFSDDELQDGFEQATTGWLSWYRSDDQYSQEKLQGDLEVLRSYYMDRGYIDFHIESSQVSISPDKKEIFITVNIREGEVYIIEDVKLTGDFVIAEEQLRNLIIIQPGEIFSRKKAETSKEYIEGVLGNLGYAFSNIVPSPAVDKENRKVTMTFLIDPGKRVYVRRVEFRGNYKTQDEVLRREIRQMEGGWFSQGLVDRSKIRMQRIGYFAEVNVETPQVPGSDDQVDVIFNVEERNAGSFSFGLGFAQTAKLILNASLSQQNFLGTGKQIQLSVFTSSFTKRIDVGYLNPYYTVNGVSRGFNLSFSQSNLGRANVANYSSDTISFTTVYGVPITESDRVSVSLGLENQDIDTSRLQDQGFIDQLERFGNPVNTIRTQVGWSRDTRNHFFLPTRGSIQRLSAEVALPGSSVQYYKLQYSNAKYISLTRRFTFLLRGDLGFGDSYGSSEDFPFFQNFFAGGTKSVRGYRNNTLGPRLGSNQNLGNNRRRSAGGALKVVGGAEIIFPTPFVGDKGTTRSSLFFDVGNVFATANEFEYDELRAAAGVSVLWQAPVGPISISFAVPINDQEGDSTESLQFTFGGGF